MAINAKLTYLPIIVRMLNFIRYVFGMPRRRKCDPSQLAADSREDQSALIDELMRRIDRLTAEVNRLKKENADLRRRLKSNSRNSSRPPSSDRYTKPKDEKREKRSPKRKKGAQPGHKGTQRALVDVQRVDKIVACHPDSCACCGGALDQSSVEGEPDRMQQWDCPPPPPIITEFQRFRHRCPHCDHVTRGSLPEGVQESSFGPNVHAIVATLLGSCHLSHRQTADTMRSMFNIPMATGSVSQIQKRIAHDLAVIHDEVREYINTVSVGHADETGWKKSGRRMWAWLLSDTLASLFVIQDRRNAKAAQSLIHEFAGTLVTDRCPSYNWYDGKRQWCWAHLIRDFEHLALFDDIEGDIGRDLLNASHRMFHDYHRWRDGTIARATFVTYARRLQREMTTRLDDGIAFGSDRFAGKCKALRSGWDMAWTFLSDEEIPPTNNLAEQSLRPLVIARKISYGNQSDIGCRFTERIMTVTASCRKQSRNVFEFLRQVFCAPSESKERPRLVPNP